MRNGGAASEREGSSKVWDRGREREKQLNIKATDRQKSIDRARQQTLTSTMKVAGESGSELPPMLLVGFVRHLTRRIANNNEDGSNNHQSDTENRKEPAEGDHRSWRVRWGLSFGIDWDGGELCGDHPDQWCEHRKIRDGETNS